MVSVLGCLSRLCKMWNMRILCGRSGEGFYTWVGMFRPIGLLYKMNHPCDIVVLQG